MSGLCKSQAKLPGETKSDLRIPFSTSPRSNHSIGDLLRIFINSIMYFSQKILGGSCNFKGKPIRGTKSDDNIVGTRNEDIIYRRAGDDRLNGGADDDVIYGDDGDVLTGGPGDDIVISGAGLDILIGSSGTDAASDAKSKTGLTINMTDTRLSTGDAFEEQCRQIEYLIGG